MGSSRALITAAALAIGVTSGAAAADLLPPPPMVAPPPPPADFGTWYLRGDVGVGAAQISGWRDTLAPLNAFGNPPPAVLPVFADLGDSAHFGAGFGYKFGSWFRVDVTGEYRTKANYRAGVTWFSQNGGFGADVYSASLSTALFLANGYVDLGTWWGLTPYVGGGVGVAANEFSGFIDHTFGYARDTSVANFAWAASAGVAFDVTPRLKVDIGYRYLDLGSIKSNPIVCLDVAACWYEQHNFRFASHDVRLGLRYALGGEAAVPVMAPPGPLVRKY
jgi:opacity protein-like surface antigen